MDSIEYYNRNAGTFYENTIELNMDSVLDRFIEYLPEGSAVLDLGCGSGRDSFYFIENGFDVTALDGSKELCELAEIHIGQDVLNLTFDEMDFDDVFDGIWACASLIHVDKDEIDDILKKVIISLKTGGILYMSFRHGDFSGYRGQRYFQDLKMKSLKELIGRHSELEILEIFLTDDVRTSRNEEWINVFAKKVK